MIPKIFPKTEHLRITMYANSLLGVWPFIFEDNPMMQQLYNIYSKFTVSYYFVFIITAIIKFFILVTDEVIVTAEVMANLCITLLYSVTIMRVFVIKSTRVKALIRSVINLEANILKSEDKHVIKIYNSYANQSKISNKIFIVNIFFVTALYYVRPMFVKYSEKYYASRNETVVSRVLPLSSWLPFDDQQHYKVAFSWQLIDGCMGASFVTYTDIFTFSLIIFPLGQIKILMHILKNFEIYVSKIKKQLNCSAEEASFVTLRECVLKHKEIIRYVNEFNAAMRYVMLMDFLQSSLQLASIVLQILVASHLTIFGVVYSGQFAFSMFIRLLVYYWYANEIMMQSSNIGNALGTSKWYDHPQRVKYMFQIMLMRCNRELCLEIGPFTTMSLRTFLGILKATYSYMMLIYKS